MFKNFYYFSKFKNLIKLILIFTLIIISIFPVSPNKHPFYLTKKAILENDKNKTHILIKGRNFLNKCLYYQNKQEYKYVKSPKISIIIPMFNCEKTIKFTLNSIQYQNMSDFEIILINDFSIDNTLKLINNITKMDKRIKVINNRKNMGTLFSRSIGVLMSKGEYIFGIDNDDMFFDDDVFNYIYKKGKKENLDILGFLTIDSCNYTINISQMMDLYTYQYPDELYLEQPELSTWMIKFDDNFLLHNNMIWDKCVKSSVYQRAVNLLGKNRYSKYLSWAEDTSINFIIFNTANSFKYIHKYGIFHLRSFSSASYTQPIDSKLYGDIFFFDILFDFSKNDTMTKNLIIGQAVYICNEYKKNKFNKDTNWYYLKYVLKKLVNSNYLYKINKRKIKSLFREYFK